MEERRERRKGWEDNAVLSGHSLSHSLTILSISAFFFLLSIDMIKLCYFHEKLISLWEQSPTREDDKRGKKRANRNRLFPNTSCTTHGKGT